MNRLQLKREITALLEGDNLNMIFSALENYPQVQSINCLFTCLCHAKEIVRWHAVSSFGVVVSALAEKDLEGARTIMRRFLWMLNDESGGIGWGIPEAMGEVMYCHEILAQEYIHMLVSYTLDDGPEPFQDGNFIELPMLQQGVLWGLNRVAIRHRILLEKQGLAENLGCYFNSQDSQVRGFVCLLCRSLRLGEYRKELLLLSEDRGHTRLYNEGVFADFTVGQLARTALAA
ncbi:MAG: HEAT repeat domain-containing protein [Deltaproteobacteria bacterium]|nr:HEAT repeat domain-containing protein [Deltaproteobacteria bacterium]